MSKCSKCGGTGLIHFRNRHDTFIDCDCKIEVEHYQQYTPDMFDFPMSDTFRGFAYEYCNQPDPGYIPPEPPEPKPQIVEHLHYNIPQQGYVRYLENKITEKQQRKPKPSGYKGIK